jgi:2-polyprenyl-3-methyl-5-hydroxy-6-metoxy-1,4-benzoquinol methylase
MTLSGPVLTERQRREQTYYDEYVKRTTPTEISFAPVLGGERRPWNPYWCVADIVTSRFTGSSSERLLDVGCGPGNYAIQFAQVGYQVFGVDISPGNIDTAARLAARYNLAERTEFGVGTAERLDYPDGHFDVIVGIDILHHVEIHAAMLECLRVLKPDGVAVFKEPIEAPLFDRLRNTRLGRAIRPKEP